MLIDTCPLSAADEDQAIRSMFAARKAVFIDLLRWDLPVLADLYEVDAFDTPDARYLIYAERDRGHRASTRLLPTQQPHLLDTHFADLCVDGVPRGSEVREISRFCLDRNQTSAERRQSRNCLVSALVDHALNEDISLYTGIAEMGWYEQIQAFGWDCAPLGPPKKWRTGWLTALQIAITNDTRDRVRNTGIYREPDMVRSFGADMLEVAA